MPQFFFSFNYTQNSSLIVNSSKPFVSFASLMTQNATVLPSPAKFSLFPVSKNSVLLQIDNVGDKFDVVNLNTTVGDIQVSLADVAN